MHKKHSQRFRSTANRWWETLMSARIGKKRETLTRDLNSTTTVKFWILRSTRNSFTLERWSTMMIYDFMLTSHNNKEEFLHCTENFPFIQQQDERVEEEIGNLKRLLLCNQFRLAANDDFVCLWGIFWQRFGQKRTFSFVNLHDIEEPELLYQMSQIELKLTLHAIKNANPQKSKMKESNWNSQDCYAN